MTHSLRARVMIAAAGAAAIALATPAFAQAPPKALRNIPVFAGAKQVGTDTSDLGAEGFAVDVPVRFREMIAYEVAAHPEAVYAFYAQRLGGKEEFDFEELDYERLPPGATSPVFRIPNFHKVDANKRVVLGSRPPFAPDAWISVAGFMWGIKEPSSDVSRFAVGIKDVGVAKDWSNYAPRTRIVIIRSTYATSATAAAPRAGVRRAERTVIAPAADVATAPTPAATQTPPKAVKDIPVFAGGGGGSAGSPDEATLGVAIYPGARFDAPYSARKSGGETKYYMYMSDDAPAAVVNFYRTRSGVAPTNLGADGHVFVMDGGMPMPRFAVYVSRNIVSSRPGKTVITVRKGP